MGGVVHNDPKYMTVYITCKNCGYQVKGSMGTCNWQDADAVQEVWNPANNKATLIAKLNEQIDLMKLEIKRIKAMK